MRRGIQIAAHKYASTRVPIRRVPIPKKLILGLHQHQGSPAEPIVRPGQRVLKGQPIAEAHADRSAAVHASTSGTVLAIEDGLVPAADQVHRSTCIVIETDGKDEAFETEAATAWPDDAASRLERIRDGGIVGLGGAVFPTAEKLGGKTACRWLIVNGAECEPYISCDDMLMREAPRAIVEGALLLQNLLGAESCVIAIERDKPQAIAAIDRAAYDLGASALRIAEVPAVYPAGSERQLIQLLTGTEISRAQYPSMLGFVCQNVATAHAVQQLATLGRPLISRVVTVTGRGIAKPQNVEALIGTPIGDLIEFCGGYRADVSRLIHGGSMMGYALASDEYPISKASNCIIAAAADELREPGKEWPCIRCGDCGTACPVRLLPQELSKAARASDYDLLEVLGLEDCIECGCCDVVCPSHIPLTEEFRRAKYALARHERQLTFSAGAERRYLQRQRRLQADDDAEKDRQNALKAKLSTNKDDVNETIRAAIERSRRNKGKTSDPGPKR